MITIKSLHIALALLSLSGFILRGMWMLRGSALLQRRAARIMPHIVDTLLLLSGLFMLIRYHIYPTQQPWLAAKLSVLLVYIVLGSIALKRGASLRLRAIALALALFAFAYMLAAALTHRALPWMTWIGDA